MIQARANGTYRDQTGNLRASVGYVVVADGRLVSSSFGQGPGEAEGERAAVERALAYSSGIVLIVVADMHYAVKVESQGMDVLSSSEQYAKANLPRLLREFTRR